MLKEAQPSAGAPRSYGGGGSSGYTHYPSSSGNSGAALAGAAIGLGIIGIIVVAQAIKRQREQRRESTLISANLDALDIEAAMERSVRANFTELEWFREPKVSQEYGYEAEVVEHASGNSSSDALAVLKSRYVFGSDFENMTVFLDVALYPVSSRLRLAQGMEPGVQTPFFREEATWVVPVPEEKRGPAEANLEYWKADNRKAAHEALDTAVMLATAKLFAALTDPQNDLQAKTVSVSAKATQQKENVFPSIDARNEWYREKIGAANLTWPVGVFGIVRTCEDIDLVDECREMMAGAKATLKQKRERLFTLCEAARIKTISGVGASTETASCSNLDGADTATQVAATSETPVDTPSPRDSVDGKARESANTCGNCSDERTYEKILAELEREFVRSRTPADGGVFIGVVGDNSLVFRAFDRHYEATLKGGAASGHETVQCTGVSYWTDSRKVLADCIGIQLGPRALVGSFPQFTVTTERGYNNYQIYTDQPDLSFRMTYQLSAADREGLEKQAQERFAAQDKTAAAATH